MRSLPTVDTSNNVLIDIEFSAKLTDGSSTWTFPITDIINVSPINWEVPYLGGFGKVSDYTITLQTSEGFNKDDVASFIRAETALKITANSDSFTPHVGRIRSIERGASDRNVTKFRVFDRFFDDNPTFPPTLSDSYDSLPTVIINKNIGRPAYYGKQSRPFYMTPVNSAISLLLGPTNINSASHVTSVYFRPQTKTPNGGENFLVYKGSWDATTNLATGANNFPVYTDSLDSYMFTLGDVLTASPSLNPVRESRYQTKGVQRGDIYPYELDGSKFHYTKVTVNPLFAITQTRWMNFNCTLNHTIDVLSVTNVDVHFAANSGNSDFWAHNFNVNCDTNISSLNIAAGSPAKDTWFLKENTESMIQFQSSTVWPDSDSFFESNFGATADLNPNEYKYGSLQTQVNCTSIAISENPFEIVAHICSDSGIAFATDQFSYAQSQVGDIEFNCFFDEIENLSDTFDDFGKQIGGYFWVGDSGYLNTQPNRDGSNQDFYLNDDLIIEDSLTIKENILGSSAAESTKVRGFTLDYNYNFATGQYDGRRVDSYQYNDPTSYYHEMNNSGVKGEKSMKTKYVLTSETAYNVARIQAAKVAHDDTILTFSLPPTWLGVEIADKFNVISDYFSGRYYIVKLSTDYMTGISQVTATKNRNTGVR